MKQNLLLIIGIIVILTTCQSVTKQSQKEVSQAIVSDSLSTSIALPFNDDNDIVSLHVGGQIKLYVGNRSLNYGFHLRLWKEKGQELLSMKSKTDSIRLVIFDWRAKKLLHSVAFPMEGPNGVGIMDDGYVASLDSIFIKSNLPQSVYITTFKKTVKHKYSIPYSPKYYSISEWIGREHDNLWGVLWPDVDATHHVQKLRGSAVFAKLNIRSGQFETAPINYPTLFTNEWKSWEDIHFQPQAVIQSKALVYQFPAIDSLYVLNLQTQEKKAYYVRSRYKRTEPAPKRQATTQEVLYVTQHSTSYMNLVYDPYRHCYYRLVCHTIEEPQKYISQLQVTLNKPLSIQIIDSNFKLIGETMLPKNKYFVYDAFVTTEGLWLSTSNPNNLDNDEDYMAFDLLKLVKNED